MDDRVNPVHSLLMAILVVNSLVWMQTAMPMIWQKTKWMRRCIWLLYLIDCGIIKLHDCQDTIQQTQKRYNSVSRVLYTIVFFLYFPGFVLSLLGLLLFSHPFGVRLVLRHLLPRCTCQGWAANVKKSLEPTDFNIKQDGYKQ